MELELSKELELLVASLEEYISKWEDRLEDIKNIINNVNQFDNVVVEAAKKNIIHLNAMIYLAQWIINSITQSGGLTKVHETNICNILLKEPKDNIEEE